MFGGIENHAAGFAAFQQHPRPDLASPVSRDGGEACAAGIAVQRDDNGLGPRAAQAIVAHPKRAIEPPCFGFPLVQPSLPLPSHFGELVGDLTPAGRLRRFDRLESLFLLGRGCLERGHTVGSAHPIQLFLGQHLAGEVHVGHQAGTLLGCPDELHHLLPALLRHAKCLDLLLLGVSAPCCVLGRAPRGVPRVGGPAELDIESLELGIEHGLTRVEIGQLAIGGLQIEQFAQVRVHRSSLPISKAVRVTTCNTAARLRTQGSVGQARYGGEFARRDR